MKHKGFTLIELMIVVAIIAFLASIALPRYFTYYAKAKQAEVTMILASLHTAQQAYWAEHGAYTTNLQKIGWQPEGYNGGGKHANFHYTYGFFFPGAQEGVHYFTGKLEVSGKQLDLCYANKNNFLAKAAGSVSNKNQLDIWSINESRSIKHEKNGIS